LAGGESARARVLSDRDLLQDVADFVITYADGSSEDMSIQTLRRWELVCRRWRQVSREGRWWDRLAREWIPCLSNVREDNDSCLLIDYGIVGLRDALRASTVAWHPNWVSQDPRCPFIVMVRIAYGRTLNREVGQTLSSSIALATIEEGGGDDDEWCGIYLDERSSMEWGQPAAFEGSRQDLMGWHSYHDLEVEILVGRKSAKRFTQLWGRDTRELWGGGGLAWVAAECDYEDAPDGSFLLQSELKSIYSILYPDGDAPVARLSLTVVPSNDGKSLNDPCKTWTITHDKDLVLQFPIGHKRRAIRLIRGSLDSMCPT
jgi:hypothetical protein